MGCQIDNVRAASWTFHGVSFYRNWQEFIVTDLEKYTSYEGETKSCVELKESSNFDANFKPNINSTAKV